MNRRRFMPRPFLRVEEETQPRATTELVAWKCQLADGVQAIEAFGDFASQSTYTGFVNPGLEVADVPIPLPLPDLYAEQIKAVARTAPFGRGDETVVDYSVRLTWELNHDEIRSTNPSWQGFLATLVQDAAAGLGLTPDEVRVEPYKLLLYEKGSFFKPHKDSEKTPGMIGSLVVCLPSRHEGGAVHLSHAGQTRVFATAPSSAFDLTAMAWYSDVTHEVKEVTSGHRLALTYNIVQTSARGPGEKSAGFLVQRQAQLRGLLARWPRDFPDVARLVLFTDHKYTPESLSASNLMKGRDRAVFESLRSLCAETGMYIFLANVQKKRYDEDDYEDYPFDDEDEEVGVSLDCLCTPEGKTVSENVKIAEEDILGLDPYQGREPDEKEEGEFTGNEGQPDKFRYYNSAIVLIPKDKLHDLLPGSDDMALVSYVQGNYLKNPKDLGLRAHTIRFMDKALDLWHTYNRRTGGGVADPIRSAVMTTAWTTGDDELYRKVIRAYTSSGKVPDELVEKIAFLLNRAPSAPRASDWTKRWWEVFRAPVNLTSLFAAVEKFEGLLDQDDAKTSFRAWAASSKRRIFESKTQLSVADLDGVMSLATPMWDDRDWISAQLVPKLQASQNQAFVSKAIDALVEKGSAGILPGAEDIAKEILGPQLPRLHLGSVDFWSLIPSSPSAEKSWDETERFLNLIETCLKYGWVDEATELFRLSNKHVRQRGPTPQPNTSHISYAGTARPIVLANDFVDNLGTVLQEADAPFIEPAQKLVEHILRTYIVGTPPALPPKPEGWAFQPRSSCSLYRRHGVGAGAQVCHLCQALNQFLADPARETGEFCDTQTARRHIEQQLPAHLVACHTDPSGRGGRRCQTLVVTKKARGAEHAEAMEAYTADVRRIESKTEKFRGEKFRKILGEELYGELILLNRLHGSQAAGGVGVPQAVVGVKREAEDDNVVPPPARRRYRPAWGYRT